MPLRALTAELDELLSKANQIRDLFELSFFAMLHLPYLQPFADTNNQAIKQDLAEPGPLRLVWRDFIK